MSTFSIFGRFLFNARSRLAKDFERFDDYALVVVRRGGKGQLDRAIEGQRLNGGEDYVDLLGAVDVDKDKSARSGPGGLLHLG